MSYFSGLVRNEWMKVTSKRQLPYYLYFLLLVLIAATGFTLWAKNEGANPDSLTFTTGVFFIMYQMTSIFSIVVTSQIITDEFKDGTIKQLLIRPASRTTVLMSKLLTAISVVFFVYLLTLIVTAAVAYIAFDSSTGGIGALWDGLILPFLLKFPADIFYILLAFTVAVLTRSLGLSISVSVILMFSSGMLLLAASKPWYKYTVFPHLDWGPYYMGESPIPGISFGFSLGMYALYVGVLLLVSIFVFKKRDIQ